MKKPVFKSDVAFVLGKAAQHCKGIREIFEAINVEHTDDMERALISIEHQVDMEIDKLKGKK